MDGIEGLLARDFGVRRQGKAAPMAAARGGGSAWANPRSTPAPSYDGLFGAPGPAASASGSASDPSLDSIFDSFKGTSSSTSAAAAAGTKPAFDDDFFNPVGGLRPSNSTSSTARYDSEDVFGTGAAPGYDDVFTGSNRSAPPSYDDFLGGFSGKPQAEEMKRSAVVEDDDLLGGFGMKPAGEKKKPVMEEEDQQGNGFDDLIPGFSGISPPKSRKTSDGNTEKASVSTSKSTASMVDDPFVILEGVSAAGSAYPSPGRFTDPLEDLDEPVNSKGKNFDSTAHDGLFEDSSTFDQVPKSDPLFTSKTNGYNKDSHPQNKARDSRPVQSSVKRNSGSGSLEDFVNGTQKSQSVRYSDIHVDDSSERYSGNGVEDQSPISTESEDDIWLTVSEIPLFTRPTSAPPPSRSPPLLKQKPLGAKANGKDDYKYSPEQADVSSVDESEVAMGKTQRPASYDTNAFDDDEEYDANSSARDERESQERLEQAQEMRLREEQKRREKERELEHQREKQAVERATKEARERAAAEARAKAERDARQRSQRAAVQRAHQEARERAAAEAKDRVARAAAEEREIATAEAKERERSAARERAAAEAKERERTAARERATAERAATERVQQEARKRAERAAVERAAAEARERHAAAAAAAAKEKQSTPDDLDSFFRDNSAPKQRAATVESTFDFQPQGKGSQRTASTSASTRKATNAPSATNIFGNGLSDLFEFERTARSSSDVFQDIEGESEERRRARLERHQRTSERAAKALAEKNERDMQVQREQAERDRIGDSLDFEIKRWAAGKETNLRALISTLQYILWPECGWQAVSLTDLITGAAVKKQYRKATLCIHPDKVQQKGATLQQKYIAEKVFDMLKEAWNKFNSEELF